MASMSSPPSGTVTFLFTDIEGSTRLAQAFPAEWPATQAHHHQGTRAGVDCRREFALPFSELCSSDERHKASVGDWTSPGRPMDDCNSLYNFGSDRRLRGQLSASSKEPSMYIGT